MGFGWDVARAKASSFCVSARPLLVFSFIIAISLDSQVYGQQGGVGQATGPGANFDPVSQLQGVGPLATVIGSDPTTQIGFQSCELAGFQQIQQEDALNNANAFSNRSMTDLLTTGGAAAMATAISAGAGAGSQAAFAGASQTILGLPGTCSGVIPPIPDKTKCEDFQTSSSTDGFDEAGMRKVLAQVQQAEGIARCKALAGKKAAKSSECFETEMNRVKTNMDILKKQFEAAQEQAKTYETFLNDQEQKETQNVQQLTEKLESLNTLLADTDALLKSIGGAGDKSKGDTLTALKQQASEQRDRSVAFNLEKLNAGAARTAQCFKEGSSSSSGIHNCPSASGELLTPEQCVLSIFRDQKALELSGGTSRISPADAKKAEFAKKNLEKRLSQMLGDFGGSNPRIKTAQGFELVYGNELRQFGVAGQQMLDEIKNCAKDVEGDISRELQDPTSNLGSKAVALRETGETIAGQMNTMRQQLDSKMRDTIANLFGAEPNDSFNSGDCTATQQSSNPTDGGAASTNFLVKDLGKSFNCLDFLARSLQATLDGTPLPNSKVLNIPLDVPGADGSSKKIFCRGIRDCRAAVNSSKGQAATRLKNITGSGTFQSARCAPSGQCEGREKFHATANEKMRKALQLSADAFGRRASVLKTQQARVRALFTAAGVKSASAATTIKKAQPKKLSELCPDEAKVCDVPTPFDEELSALAGVPPITAEDFASMRDAAQAESDAATTKLGEFTALEATLATGIEKCLKDKANKKLEKKVATLRLDFDRAKSKCTRAAGKLQPKTDEFANGLDKLASDLTTICSATADNTECQKLSKDISEGQDDCRSVLDDNRVKVGEDIEKCLDRVRDLEQQKRALAKGGDAADGDLQAAQAAIDSKRRVCESLQKKLDGAKNVE